MLGPVEIAERCGVHRTTVWRMIRRGELPGVVKIGRQYRMAEDTLDRFLAGEIEPSAKPPLPGCSCGRPPSSPPGDRRR